MSACAPVFSAERCVSVPAEVCVDLLDYAGALNSAWFLQSGL